MAFSQAARALTQDLALSNIDIELGEFTLFGLPLTALTWEADPRRRVNWPWIDMREWFRRDPARFELEIHCAGRICALALGRPSASRSNCSLHYVEASPDPTHPLRGKVLAVVLTALEQYCAAIGASEMRVVQPLAALIPLYVGRYGFTLADTTTPSPYCWREVRR